MDPERWAAMTTEEFGALDNAVRSGSRLVVAMRAGFVAERDDYRAEEPLPPDPDAKKADERKNPDGKKPADDTADAKPAKLPPG